MLPVYAMIRLTTQYRFCLHRIQPLRVDRLTSDEKDAVWSLEKLLIVIRGISQNWEIFDLQDNKTTK